MVRESDHRLAVVLLGIPTVVTVTTIREVLPNEGDVDDRGQPSDSRTGTFSCQLYSKEHPLQTQ